MLNSEKLPRSTKLQWKMSSNENRYLSYYDLKVTLFPNAHKDVWSVSVAGVETAPEYFNYAAQEEARAAAEKWFIELKNSGRFRPPTISTPPLRDVLRIVRDGRITPELHDEYIEFETRLERQGERADLFCLELNPRSGERSYWVPHSQGAIIREYGGRSVLVVTRWWLERAKPAQ